MTVRQGEIGLRAHLDQARGGAVELVSLEAIARAIKPVGLGFGRGDELDRIVVERVDQNDEALGLVATLVVHDRNMIDHDGMKLMHDLEIVRGGERLLT